MPYAKAERRASAHVHLIKTIRLSCWTFGQAANKKVFSPGCLERHHDDE